MRSGLIVADDIEMIRLQLEEHFLHRELPGYTLYAERVRYRLIPGIW